MNELKSNTSTTRFEKQSHHEYTCYGDTVFSEKIVPYEKVVIQELTWWQKYGSAVMIGGFLLLFLLILKKFGKLLV